MCKCIAGWVTDEEVAGTHNAQPVTCAEYIAALEELVQSGNADSLDLERVQKAHGISQPVVAMDPADPDSWIQVDSGNGKFPPFVSMIQPFMKDRVDDVMAWKDEIMAQIAASGNARLVLPEGFEMQIGWFDDDPDDDVLKSFDFNDIVGSIQVDQEKLQARLREMGYGVWLRPEGGLELGPDGRYRAKKADDDSE